MSAGIPSEQQIVLNTLGAIEIGVLLSSVLYGVTCVQAYNYAMHTVGDRLWVRVVVAVVMFLETMQLIFAWIYFFDSSILHFGDLPSSTDNVPWQFAAVLASHGLCAFIVQMFFTYRVYRVAGKLWLALPTAVGSFVRLTFTFVITFLEPIEGLIAFKEKDEWMFYLCLTLATIVDIWVTFSLCYHLWNKRTAYRDTREKINGIITWTVETGLITSVTSIFVMITWTSWPSTMAWMSILIVYGRMYSISLLVSLNARDSRRKWGSRQTDSSKLTGAQASISIPRSFHLEMSEMSAGHHNVIPLDMSKAEHGLGLPR